MLQEEITEFNLAKNRVIANRYLIVEKLGSGWEGEGNPRSRLKDWLDQDGIGSITTDTL